MAMMGSARRLLPRARTRDARLGRFYTAVVSTGIWRQPSARAHAQAQNCIFLPAGAAHQAFRPCLRCRPEIAPGLAGFRGPQHGVARAELIAEGSGGDGGVEELAGRLGAAPAPEAPFDRHVGRPSPSLGAPHPLRQAADRGGVLGMAEIALASGFRSVRRFNDAFQHAYGRPPSALRRRSASGDPSRRAGAPLRRRTTDAMMV